MKYNKKKNYKKVLSGIAVLVAAMMAVLAGFASCSKSERSTAQTASDTVEKKPTKAAKDPFGNYPADYEIAYLSMLTNLSVTVRDLFGSSDNFATNFMGSPVSIEIESVSSKSDTFLGTLLITMDNEGKKQNLARFTAEFKADNNAKLSYARSSELTLVTGQTYGESSSGNDLEADGRVAGSLYECMQYFWDLSKFR
jgi:hypothetical protein